MWKSVQVPLQLYVYSNVATLCHLVPPLQDGMYVPSCISTPRWHLCAILYLHSKMADLCHLVPPLQDGTSVPSCSSTPRWQICAILDLSSKMACMFKMSAREFSPPRQTFWRALAQRMPDFFAIEAESRTGAAVLAFPWAFGLANRFPCPASIAISRITLSSGIQLVTKFWR